MKTLLKGGRIYTSEGMKKRDIIIKDDRIFAVSKELSNESADKVIQCDNFFIAPGFKDVHVHFREPGFSYKETILTGSLAAAKGGYTTVCCMPNIDPPPSDMDSLSKELEIIKKDAAIRVIPYGTITKEQSGKGHLSDMAAMAPYVAAFSDDGKGIQSDSLMRSAMEEAKKLGKIIVAHCEDERYKTEDKRSEYLQVERDLALAKETGAKYHVCHISCRESVKAVKKAKKEGVDVTCETAPHYLIIADHEIEDSGRFKMNPPLRSADDRRALQIGIIDGTIDMIATDHAPHSEKEKSGGFKNSLYGISGIECAFPVLNTALVRTGIIDIERLIEMMSDAPARRFELAAPEIKEGEQADLVILDMKRSGNIDSSDFISMGKSTPFDGMHVHGFPIMTICGGKMVYRNDD